MIVEPCDALSGSLEHGTAPLYPGANQVWRLYEPLPLSTRLSSRTAKHSFGNSPMTSDAAQTDGRHVHRGPGDIRNSHHEGSPATMASCRPIVRPASTRPV